jgi:hypothetical protein
LFRPHPFAEDRENARTTLDRLLSIKQQYSAEWLRVDSEFAGVRPR